MTFNYCPQCGQQGTVTPRGSTEYVCSNCGWQFWNNAKASASAIFVNEKYELLYSKRARPPKEGYYDLPGGFVDYYETPYEALIREMREETGVTVKNPILFDTVYKNEYIPGTSTADLLFVVTEWEGELTAQDDSLALEWKPLEFAASEQFAWVYPNFPHDLQRFLAAHNLPRS